MADRLARGESVLQYKRRLGLLASVIHNQQAHNDEEPEVPDLSTDDVDSLNLRFDGARLAELFDARKYMKLRKAAVKHWWSTRKRPRNP